MASFKKLPNAFSPATFDLNRRPYDLHKPIVRTIQATLTATLLFGGLAVTNVSAQTETGKMDKSGDKMSGGKMSGMKMSDKDMMDHMNKMSTADKASMYDKMTDKDKMAAMKMSGHDMAKMSSSDRMDMMGKTTDQQKADMLDKMPMAKKMSLMRGTGAMHKHSKMNDSKKMDK